MYKSLFKIFFNVYKHTVYSINKINGNLFKLLFTLVLLVFRIHNFPKINLHIFKNKKHILK